MIHQSIASYDGQEIHTYRSEFEAHKPYIVVVLPFGLRAEVGAALFAVLQLAFNVVTWRARLLVDVDPIIDGAVELDADMHVGDLRHVLRHFGIEKCSVLGFCSGAGIALLAGAEFGELFSDMVLICGEYMLPPEACPRTQFQQDVENILPLVACNRSYAAAMSEKIMSHEAEAQTEFQTDVMLPFSRSDFLHRFGVNYVGYCKIDFRDVAAKNKVETLLISTAGDRQVYAKSSEIIAAAMGANARHITVPGDHYEILRGTSEPVRTLLDFVLHREDFNEDAA